MVGLVMCHQMEHGPLGQMIYHHKHGECPICQSTSLGEFHVYLRISHHNSTIIPLNAYKSHDFQIKIPINAYKFHSRRWFLDPPEMFQSARKPRHGFAEACRPYGQGCQGCRERIHGIS